MRPAARLGRASTALLLVVALMAQAAAAVPWGRSDRALGSMAEVAGLVDAAAVGTFSDSGAIPRDRLIEMVQRRFNARVVRVNLVESGGRRIYEMRLMSEQRVWNVRVDADTGQLLDGG
ncbi:MAG: PepSY domain-containing protein [Gammaproteobacteria bacterium]|nr:PepSY domain-containing protein [Gammaproteobacteria bacterium]